MGVLYAIVPVDHEIADYLREMGESVPEADAAPRNPTPREIRAVCDALPGQRVHYSFKFGAFWQAVVEGAADPEQEPWTLLNIAEFSGSEDEPHPISFDKGWPSLILEIVRRLSVSCGPLAVIPDTGEAPIAVTARTQSRTCWEGGNIRVDPEGPDEVAVNNYRGSNMPENNMSSAESGLTLLQRVAVCFAAAVIGALAVVLFSHALFALGIGQKLGVKEPVSLKSPDVYRPLFWGGLWGIPFGLLIKAAWPYLYLFGLLYFLAPVLALFLFFLPRSGAGYFGLKQGPKLAVYLLLVNLPFGIVTALAARLIIGETP